MTYEEAQELSLIVKWKVSTCGQGEECWCRTIVPIEPILYSEYQMIDTGQEYTIVRPGELNQDLAEHFVRLHNNYMDDIYWRTDKPPKVGQYIVNVGANGINWGWWDGNNWRKLWHEYQIDVSGWLPTPLHKQQEQWIKEILKQQ